MTTVFLSGSRSIAELRTRPIERLDNIIREGLAVVVGDAPGADLALQLYLHKQGFTNVTVYVTGPNVTNNVSGWPVVNIDADPRSRGRNYHTARDEAMTQQADYGYVLWDGTTDGSWRNVERLAKAGKKALVWAEPEVCARMSPMFAWTRTTCASPRCNR